VSRQRDAPGYMAQAQLTPAAGVHMGRPPKLTQHQRREAMERREAGEPLTEIARTFNVSHSTISRLTQ
jgi:DNA invertase Pin-like site-specific DNA recombinase